MERIGVLLRKLQEQYQQNAGAEQLLLTLQMLQHELIHLKNGSSAQPSAKKIAVIFPNQVKFGTAENLQGPPAEEKIIEILQVDEKAIEEELEQMRLSAELKNQMSMKSRQPVEFNYDPLEEIPTLAAQPHEPHAPYLPKETFAEPQKEIKKEVKKEAAPIINKEVHEIISQDQASLNDRLKEQKTELAEKLQDVPVKDLKKAIGINDRYLFINDLFNGDEAMYERCIKTINGFSIYPEAEFWMERELKVKLGWTDENPQAQQFFQLVKRRFS
jgi:hypothetical protein